MLIKSPTTILLGERFDDSAPLVFTHQDLNPRNIIVGEDGRLWLIDWAWAGYYPPWFEYVTMRRQAENERTIGFNHEFWESFHSIHLRTVLQTGGMVTVEDVRRVIFPVIYG